ncbi:MAG: hypothetical protein ACP5UQ_15975 [Anaerolineae bacterium]
MAALHGLAAAVCSPGGSSIWPWSPTGVVDACLRLLAVEPWHEGTVLLGLRAWGAPRDLAAA